MANIKDNPSLYIPGILPSWISSSQYFSTIDSTNIEAWRSFKTNFTGNHLIIAREQMAGKGQRGRKWHSLPKGLWMSLLVTDKKLLDHFSTRITLDCGLAILESLAELIQGDIKLKWPNDIYLNGKKLGGILVETRWQGNVLSGVVFGIGLNIMHERDDFPEELRDSATSILIENNKTVYPFEIMNLLLANIYQFLTKPIVEAQFQTKWKKVALWINESVIINEDENVCGLFMGVNNNGAAMIRHKISGELLLESGTMRQVVK